MSAVYQGARSDFIPLVPIFEGFYLRNPPLLLRARPGGLSMWGWGRHFSRGPTPATPARETGGLSMWGGRHFSGAGETVARSTDTRRTRCSDPSPTLFIRCNGLRDRWVNGLASVRFRPCNRYTLEPAAGRNICSRHKPTHLSPTAR
jgi:hypothetical protein